MELRHLRYFAAVAETLHFRRAAERLSIAQPALSQQIQQLERELGVQLLDRTRRRVALTEAGIVFLERARATIAEAAEAVRLARMAGRGELGQLSVGVVTSALYGAFPDVVRVFRERHRQVHLTLQELPANEQTLALRAGRIHVSFLRPPIDETDLTVRIIAREPWMVALPTSHPLAGKTRVSVKALAGEPFLLFSRELAPGLYDQLIAVCQSAGFSPRIVQEAQMHTIVSLVAAGIGVSLVPATLENLSRRGLVYKKLAGTTPKLDLAVAWRRDDRSPLLAAFLSVVREMT
jgi:DNA-binding transcriptional LysR family regulator